MQGLGHWVLCAHRGVHSSGCPSTKGAGLGLSVRGDPLKSLQATLRCGSELRASESSRKPVLLFHLLSPSWSVVPSAPGHAPVSQHA